MLGHQVSDDDAGGAGQSHVAVDHDQAASSDRAVDKLRGAVEISRELVLSVSRGSADIKYSITYYLEMLQ